MECTVQNVKSGYMGRGGPFVAVLIHSSIEGEFDMEDAGTCK